VGVSLPDLVADWELWLATTVHHLEARNIVSYCLWLVWETIKIQNSAGHQWLTAVKLLERLRSGGSQFQASLDKNSSGDLLSMKKSWVW
jgi:hypothetical protein